MALRRIREPSTFLTPNMIQAQILLDSVNSHGNRITTWVLKFPRIVLAELNTHRAFSRNSASSRAIPFEKMLESVKTNPFIPLEFQKDHKGMQGSENFVGAEKEECIADWLKARDAAVLAATSFKHPVTKQLRNRILEPFLWHTAILTATEFENFFALRAHKDAEIHIQDLAYKMLDEYKKSAPKKLEDGEWHIPFGDKIDEKRLIDVDLVKSFGERWWEVRDGDVEVTKAKIKIATARCARVSYLNFDGKDDYTADITLADRLSQSGHWSPFEHCAKASVGRSGNFVGWEQYRKAFPDENRTDPRAK